MQIDLIMVGKRMPDWINTAVNEYKKRLPHHIEIKLLEITPANRQKKDSAENYKHQEQEKILKAVAPHSRLIVLDEHGKMQTSKKLATTMQNWLDDHQHVSLIIGGPDGLTNELLNRADERWSLSAMTLPHGLVRVILIEQLYRAWTILANHPYHRE